MKSISVNPKYQSQFMPIVQRAETEIKLAVLTAFLYAHSEFLLRSTITAILAEVASKLLIPDKQEYLKGLQASANKLIVQFYRKPLRAFKADKLGINMPHEAFIKSQAKGSVVIQDYAKKLKLKMKELAETPMTTKEKGKKSISLWQKAEIDIRQEHNKEMIRELKEKGNDICYISSHPDCSKRCERWQGHLVSLSKKTGNPQMSVNAPMYKFKVGSVDGKPLYSLTDIMEAVDKYGYHNSVISGFNCRHRLIPYHGQQPPTRYYEDEVADQRKIETKIRAMEREIRKRKQYAEMIRKSDPKGAREVDRAIKRMVANYKSYCNEHGYAWEDYRIKIF